MPDGTLAPRDPGPDPDPARIGPNAATQLFEAVGSALGPDALADLAADCECTGWLQSPPETMIPEKIAARLHRRSRQLFPDAAPRLMAAAGSGTAAYILANRIPRAVRMLLQAMPAFAAARLLTRAIERHAWTFAGSGTFSARPGRPLIFEIAGNPLATGEHAEAPICRWHEAVFEGLFQRLVSPRSRVRETACIAAGAPACRFAIDWR